VDFVERPNESGFEIRPKGGGHAAAPSGANRPLADRVREVLDSQVNPAIASHGGKIDLVDVRDTRSTWR
jgi:hypothetical protein